jgi:hypothetical protein
MNARAIVLGSVVLALAACERQPPPTVVSSPGAPPPSAGGSKVESPSAPAATPQGTPASLEARTFSVAGISFTTPEGWKRVAPAVPMRLAELQVPDAAGKAENACTVTFLVAGGDVKMNVDRWAGQVRDASGQPAKYEIATHLYGGFNVSTVEMTGAYAGMGDAAPRPDWMLRGAIFDTPEGQLFIKMTGPAAGMKAAAAGWTALLESIKKAG